MEKEQKEEKIPVLEITESSEKVRQMEGNVPSLRKTIKSLENSLKLLQTKNNELLKRNEELEKQIQEHSKIDSHLEQKQTFSEEDENSIKREREDDVVEVADKIQKVAGED